jgi:GT2 family glycosyltransferase
VPPDESAVGRPARRAVGAPFAALSVVIPTFNRADQLAEQLEALVEQGYPHWWEVVVVDNRCTDHTAEVLRRFTTRLPLRVVSAAARTGRPYAVNAGVSASQGEAVVLLDNDDVVDPGYLRAMGSALARHPFVGARLDSARLNPPWVRERRAPMQEHALPTLLRHRPFVIGAAFGVRRDAFDAVGGCDEDLHCLEDLDLSWRLQYAGYLPTFVPDAVLNYRYRQDLIGLWRQERSYGRWEAALYAKHRPLGVPKRRRRTVLAGWALIVRALPAVRRPAGRARLVTVLGAAVGRIEGSFRARVMFL